MVKFTPLQLTENVNVSKTSPKKEFFLLLSGIILILIFIYVISGLVLNLIIDRMPYKFEGTLSRIINTEKFLTNEKFLAEKKKAQKALDDLVAFLPEDLLDKYSVDIIQNKDINALALPGNHIIIFSGLLDNIRSENELSFVLAHELGHFAYKDHLRAFGRGIIFVFFAAVLAGNNVGINDLLSGVLGTMDLSFSREQEKRADMFALDLLNKRYGHVGGVVDFFEMMNKKNKLPKILTFASTHPLGLKRVEYINDIIDDKKYTLGPVIPFVK